MVSPTQTERIDYALPPRDQPDKGLVQRHDQALKRFVVWLFKFILIRLMIRLLHKVYEYVVN